MIERYTLSPTAPVWYRAVIAGSLGSLAGLLSYGLGCWSVVGYGNSLVPIVAMAWFVGALCAFSRHAIAILAALDSLLFAILALIALAPPVTGWTTRWVRADPRPATGVTAVIALASNVTSNGALDVVGSDRLLMALELAHRDALPRVLTTTAFANLAGRHLSTVPDERRLVRIAGLDSAWLPLDSVANTHDEAMRAAAALHASRTSPVAIAVVTSPMHTRRACATFEKVGFRVTCIPALERDYDTWHPATPEDRLAAWRAFLYERLGWIEYRWKGWV